ncbi:MAG: hypothetical protein HY719_15675 [Planctomycetes bacterium]|nr:hypothetical protein [Planctomycetota bacterium]
MCRHRSLRLWSLAAVLAAVALWCDARAARAEELPALVGAYLSAPDDAERAEALTAIAALKPTPDALMQAVQGRHVYDPDARRGTYYVVDPASRGRRGRGGQPAAPKENEEEGKVGASFKTAVFVPEEYTPDKKWSLLIGLHGAGGDADQVFKPIVDLARKSDLLMISPSAPALGWPDSAERSHVLAGLAWMKARYRVNTDRVYLMGVSMGAFGTWNNGLVYADRFAGLFPYAGGLDFTAAVGLANKSKTKLLANAQHLPIYVLHATNDETVNVEASRAPVKVLESLKSPVKFVEMPNWKHVPPMDEMVKHVDAEVMPYLRASTRDPAPAEFRYFTLRPDHQWAYHVRIDAMAREGAGLTVKRNGNRIAIQSAGVKAGTLFLNEEIVDFKKPVQVTWNGAPVFDGPVAFTPRVLLESARLRDDDRMLYTAAVPFGEAGGAGAGAGAERPADPPSKGG